MKLDLTDLTILIPTYKRDQYLIKNLLFWENYDTNIIILDGGKKPIDKNKFHNFKNNIKYFFYKESSFEKRLYMGSTKIKTPYSVIIADDELHEPSALKKSINFLKKNSDYGCCIGRCVGFKSTKNFLNLWPEKKIQAKHFVSQTNLLNRIKYHIKNYTPSTLYAVHKTKSFKFSTKIFKTLEFDSPYIQETIFEILASAYAKCKVLPYLSWFRSYENNPIIDKNSRRLYFLSIWFDEKKNFIKIKCLKKNLVHLISSLRKNRKKEIQKLIDEVLEHRIVTDRKSRLSAELRYDFKNDNHLFKSLFKKIKNFIKYILIKSNVGNFCFFINKSKFNYHKLKKADIKFKDNDLNFISSFLLEYNDIKNR